MANYAIYLAGLNRKIGQAMVGELKIGNKVRSINLGSAPPHEQRQP